MIVGKGGGGSFRGFIISLIFWSALFIVTYFVYSCAGTKTLPTKPRPLIYESKLALDVFELSKEAEWFPMYERKQIRRMLVELHEYIMKQITNRIDKHPIGERGASTSVPGNDV